MNALQDLLRTPAALWRHAGGPTGVKGFVSFDALRGYMAWWVVVSHALYITGMQERFPSIFSEADHAVNVFVSLSGFVICHLLLERREPYQAYLTRRAFRIFPIYLLALACAIALSGAYDFVYQSDWIAEKDMRLMRAASTDAHFATYLGLHLTLLHGLVPDTWLPFSGGSLLVPAWSLSLEWQFYLLAPLIVGGLARTGWSRLASFIVLCAAWVVFKKFLPLHWQFPSVLPLSIHFFMLGILSRVFMPLISRFTAWIIPVGLIASALGPYSIRAELAIWSVFFAAACGQLGVTGSRAVAGPLGFALDVLTSNRVMRRLGESSYSTYLIHIPLFSLLGWIAAQMTDDWSQRVAIGSTVVAMVLLAPLSSVLYRFVEQPFIGLGARVARSRAALAAGLPRVDQA
jgi:peptidoglycan/LPS O-acetylase OafA/YrhL